MSTLAVVTIAFIAFFAGIMAGSWIEYKSYKQEIKQIRDYYLNHCHELPYEIDKKGD